jgi:hypothetical protein
MSTTSLETISVETIREAMRAMVVDGIPSPGYGLGRHIVLTPHALEKTKERLFPFSKHRSMRMHKKLCKRYGGEFVQKPTAFFTKDRLYVHPTLYEEFKRHVPQEVFHKVPPVYGGPFSL